MEFVYLVRYRRTDAPERWMTIPRRFLNLPIAQDAYRGTLARKGVARAQIVTQPRYPTQILCDSATNETTSGDSQGVPPPDPDPAIQ